MTVGAELFRAERTRLLGVGYRVTGVWADAEEVVAEAYARLLCVDEPRSRAAWLTTVVTRLAIDRLRRRAKETYVGPWLPEPIDTALLPDEGVEQRATLHLGLLAVCEQLAPFERAAFVLREAYALPHREIAAILEISEAGARQHLSRARRRLRSENIRTDAAAESDALGRLATALAGGDPAQVAALLTDDAQVWTDGGGKVSAARRVIEGPAKATRFLLATALTGDIQPATANGGPAAVSISRAVSRLAWVVLRDDRIAKVCIMANPDKLAAAGVGDRIGTGGQPAQNPRPYQPPNSSNGDDPPPDPRDPR